MGKAVLMVVAGSLLLLTAINLTINRRINQASDTVYKTYNDEYARNMSNSLLDMVFSFYYDSTDWRVTSPASVSFFGGTSTYTLKDSVMEGDSIIKVNVRSTYQGSVNTMFSILPRTSSTGGWIPPVCRAAWTANGDLNKTISDMNIDGRDHTLAGTLISNKGVLGVTTGGDFNNTYKAKIGGTADSVDYAPTFPQNNKIIESNYDWGGKFPKSPDEILGYPEGTLLKVAKSGVNGSQYITDLKKMRLPITGVTYFEAQNGKSYSVDFGNKQSTGIFIWHNPQVTGKLSGIKSDLPFKGVLVGDYGFHFHLNVIGAIVLLSKNLEMGSTCNGNNAHSVLFSSEIVKAATGIAAKYSGVQGNNPNWGGSSRAIGNVNSARVRKLYIFE